jgi:hypothetical protein
VVLAGHEEDVAREERAMVEEGDRQLVLENDLRLE